MVKSVSDSEGHQSEGKISNHEFDEHELENADDDEENQRQSFDLPVKKKTKYYHENHDDLFDNYNSSSSSSLSSSSGSDENYEPSENDNSTSNGDTASKYNVGCADFSNDGGDNSELYFEMLEKSVKDRTFDLKKIRDHEVISTGRTIKQLKAWRGHWPPLREFLQNTVDHLCLLDPRTGRRRKCLSMRMDKLYENRDVRTVLFTCEETIVCRFDVEPDKLLIYQQYTYPIASRAVDTGVLDRTKALGLTAGNFGDGFKSAAVALMADPQNDSDDNITWNFHAIMERVKVKWSFQGLEKENIATFEGCKMLQIVIDKQAMAHNELARFTQTNSNSGYVMEQIINIKGIGNSFLEKALPSFVVFWHLKEDTLISALRRNIRKNEGNHFLAPASQQPRLFGGNLNSLKPRPGIYVQGIFVCKSKITDGIMSYYGKRLEVVGRDRNNVDEDQMLKATIYILKHSKNMEYLRRLMEPLRGDQECSALTKDSWLLKPKAFFNRIIHEEKEFILYDVLKISKNSIFISDNTMKGQEKLFFDWAKRFLEHKQITLTPIPEKANRTLFKSVDESKIRKICARVLNKESKGKGRRNISVAQTIIRKFISFLGLKDVKASNIVMSKEVEIPFTYEHRVYIPESKLNQESVITIIAMCFQKLQTFDGEVEMGTYTALIRAIGDKLSSYSECTKEIADKIVSRAKQIKNNYSKFLEKGHEGTYPHQTLSPDFELINDKIKDLVERIENEWVPRACPVRNSFANRSHHTNTFSRMDTQAGQSNNDGIESISALDEVQVGPSFGGGSIYCDERTAKMIEHELFKESKRKKIVILREALDDACKKVMESIPSTSTLMNKRMRHAYDGKNKANEALSSGTYIYINLYAFLPKVPIEAESPHLSLVNDFVILLTGEISHLLEPNPYHGCLWKETHMKMINQIMQYLELL